MHALIEAVLDRDATLTPEARWLGVIVAGHMDDDDESLPTITALAAEAGMTPRTARRHIATLKAAGLIDYRRSGDGRPNRYGIGHALSRRLATRSDPKSESQ